MLHQQVVTYNGLLALTIKLFIDNPKIISFYNAYFKVILIDEYQDTNVLSYWLITLLISTDTKVIFFGDSLQRIYGFIGAIPDLLCVTEKRFGLDKISLEKNYRFASNPEMLQLDQNIRKIAENPQAPIISGNAIIDYSLFQNQDEESQGIINKVRQLLQTDKGLKIAILVKQRGVNVNKIMNTFESEQLSYFYGLFTDEDSEYIKFHKSCTLELVKLINPDMRITKKVAEDHLEVLKKSFLNQPNKLFSALVSLLEIFWKKIFTDYGSFSNQEKITFVIDTFEHYGLKQYIEFVDANITFSTVHAAKGLEWDYVFIPDMEQDLFPNWFGLCRNCVNKKLCIFEVRQENEREFLEELSVFYVAVTRAKKKVLFSSSKNQLANNDAIVIKNQSCFLKLPGITH